MMTSENRFLLLRAPLWRALSKSPLINGLMLFHNSCPVAQLFCVRRSAPYARCRSIQVVAPNDPTSLNDGDDRGHLARGRDGGDSVHCEIPKGVLTERLPICVYDVEGDARDLTFHAKHREAPCLSACCRLSKNKLASSSNCCYCQVTDEYLYVRRSP